MDRGSRERWSERERVKRVCEIEEKRVRKRWRAEEREGLHSLHKLMLYHHVIVLPESWP